MDISMKNFDLLKKLEQQNLKINMLPFKKDIMTAIEQGYSVKTIWKTFNKNKVLDISYHAFAYRVRQWKKMNRYANKKKIYIVDKD